MIVLYQKSFLKELKTIKDNSVKRRIKASILELKNSKNVESSKLEKLKGHPFAYKLRVGDYRIGCYAKSDQEVTLSRISHRKDIYRVFP